MIDTSTNDDECGWIEETKKGNCSAFNRVVLKYQRPIYNLCYRMLADSIEAEDATQEIFARAYFKLNTYDDRRSKFSTWLFAIASHYCIDKLRPRRLKLVSWDDLSSFYRYPAQDAAEPERVLMRSETTEEVQKLLTKLPPDYRVVVVLKYWQLRSYEEIARTLGTTVGAIKSKLFRARKMMAAASAQQRTTPVSPGHLAFSTSYRPN
jgi:RNA polymerase sigma-70 factor (ECF subfamily)